MSRRGAGGGRRGGGGSDYGNPPSHPSPSRSSQQQQQRGGRGGRGGGEGGGGGGGGGGRGRRGGGRGGHQPPAAYATYTQQGEASSSAAAAADVSSLSSNVEQSLSIQDTVGAGSSTTTTTTSVAAAVPTPPPQQQPSSSKSIKPPPRPSYGTAGKKCMVRANHFLVQLADKDLTHYDVAITPEVPSRGVNRAVIRQLVDMYRESHLGKKQPVYDGRKSMYTAGALAFTSKEFVIKLTDNDQTTSLKKEREFKVVIKLAGHADLHHLRQFIQGKQMEVPQDAIQVLDVVLRESPSANYVTVARSFFSPKLGERVSIGDGMECWKGYYQSLRPTQMGLSLNIDIAATSFYKPLPVIDFVAEYLNIRDITRPLSDTDRVKIKKALRGVKVEVTHRPESRRRYRITGITSVSTNQLTFPVDDQATARIYVVQYFREKYQVNLRHVVWPCLQAGTDIKPTYLPMEVCKIVEGQRYVKKLNERQVTAILRATCKRPYEREQSIVEMAKRNNYRTDEFAKEFGITVVDKLTSVEARVLPPPMLKYHDTGREKMCRPSVGQWNMINKRMVNGGIVNYWACLNFSRLHPDAVGTFCYDLVGMCQNIGMLFEPKPLINTCSVRPENVERALIDVQRQSTARLASQGIQGKQLQLLIVVLPEISGLYGRIKRICETELGIVSQCCQPRNVSKNNKQYQENVALKINVKVGGRNTVLIDALSRSIPFVTDKPTIIFGADVTHPPAGEDSSPSIAAVVASMDWPEVTKYRCLVSAQPHRQEMIKDLYIAPEKGCPPGSMIRELLIAFRRATNQKPHRIIFYRDGVSEGQFNAVLLYEMDAIRKACQSLESDYLPPVTFVVVQKRHHTRLFPFEHGNRQMTDRSGNILPGTVVDTKICHPTEFDFYLCSHAGIQGTSRPTHYHVLYDENRFTADALQQLTNNLCYTYARCTRSVSVVPPAYYAHLAAFRARYYIEGDTSDGGSTSGGNIRERVAGIRPLPKIKDNVKDVMFYC